MHTTSRLLALHALIALIACAPLPEPPAAAARTGAEPPEPPPKLGQYYRLSSEESAIRALIYRAGALASLGHNHVVATAAIDGGLWLADTAAASSIEFSFTVADMIIDDPRHRADAGEEFSGELSAGDIAGTRRNMLSERLLHAAEHPAITVRSRRIRGEFPYLDIVAGIDIRGTTHELTFPVTVEIASGRVTASGRRRISHDALGLEPFSVMLGALSVQNEFDLHYEFVAVRDVGGYLHRSNKKLSESAAN